MLRDLVTLTGYGTWCDLFGQTLCQVWTGYNLPFHSSDEYNFPSTTSCRL